MVDVVKIMLVSPTELELGLSLAKVLCDNFNNVESTI